MSRSWTFSTSVVAVMFGFAAGLLTFGPGFLPVGAVIAPALLIGLLYLDVRLDARQRLREFERRYGGDGVRMLVFTSASAMWEERIRELWMPRLGSLARLVDRSSPEYARGECKFEAELLRRFQQGREHTPAVLIVPPKSPPAVLTFFEAFRDLKHGRGARLAQVEGRLFEWADRLAG